MDSIRISDPLIARVLRYVHEQSVPAWVVGGFVRDALLGHASHDLDLVVPQGGIQLARAVAAAFRGSFFILDRERDVARAIVSRDHNSPLNIDVARLRTPQLLDDLAHRDFTFNAMAVRVEDDRGVLEVYDPFGGLGDLQRKRVRAVTEGTFRDDPLRMLRAVRMAAEFGFSLEHATSNLIRRDAALLPSVSPERVRDELMRVLTAPGAWRHVRLLAMLDLLRFVLPEAHATIGVRQSPPHYMDVFDHSRAVMAHMEGLVALLWPESEYRRPAPVLNDPVVITGERQWQGIAQMLAPYADDLRAHLMQPLASGHVRRDWLFWGALAHDWGKAETSHTGETGRIHFFGHEHASARLAENRLRALAFAAGEAAYLARLVDTHMRPGFLAKDAPASHRAVYRYFRAAGSTGPDAAVLSLVDKTSTWAPDPDEARVQEMLGTVGRLLDTYFRQRATRVEPAPLLDGHQLMTEFGLDAGPMIGKLLEGLREAQATGAVSDVEQARKWVRRRVQDRRKERDAHN